MKRKFKKYFNYEHPNSHLLRWRWLKREGTRRLAESGVEIEEIIKIMGISKATYYNHLKDDFEPNFKEYVKNNFDMYIELGLYPDKKLGTIKR